MSVTFLIKYARATTDTSVRGAFEATLECEVLKVTALDKIDIHNGNRPFKMFFIVVKKNERVDQFAEQIKRHGFMTIVYKDPYFWKIHLAENKPAVVRPRIMTIEEQDRIVRRAPAQVAAPVAAALEPGEIVEPETKSWIDIAIDMGLKDDRRLVEPLTSGIYELDIVIKESEEIMQECLAMAAKRPDLINDIPPPARLERSPVKRADSELMPPPPPRAPRKILRAKQSEFPRIPEVTRSESGASGGYPCK